MMPSAATGILAKLVRRRMVRVIDGRGDGAVGLDVRGGEADARGGGSVAPVGGRQSAGAEAAGLAGVEAVGLAGAEAVGLAGAEAVGLAGAEAVGLVGAEAVGLAGAEAVGLGGGPAGCLHPPRRHSLIVLRGRLGCVLRDPQLLPRAM